MSGAQMVCFGISEGGGLKIALEGEEGPREVAVRGLFGLGLAISD